MAVKIDTKIVDYEVGQADAEAEAAAANDAGAPSAAAIEHMHEELQRPERLEGQTYKIKTPLSEHALYVTVNDLILNEGTEHELRRPFEVFINSKNMDHFQWIVALTRIISAVFRKGGDCTFLVEELRSVFDPRGGYFKKGGRFMPSLVAEIGEVLEQHLRSIGMIESEGLDEHQRRYIEQKKAEATARGEQAETAEPADEARDDGYPAGAELCGKCHVKAMVVMDGCLTCLNCGDSKCG
ncbi:MULTISPECIES: NrdJb [Spiribacter]|uniref:TSCPD domain-containing protein n=1 Tax=Spiribacter TaxID=1335745 RepID=UPI001330A382|nr:MULTISPECIES: NrdJb [Spiribacter]KAF0284294.1 NrdJb [Spiribacter roseus]KAF0286479.1 NrdJb [Spiribacter sp. SSL99]